MNGGTCPAQSARIFYRRSPSLFGSFSSTIGRFDERFRDGQYSLVSFLLAVLLLTLPPRAQSFVKVGGVPSVPYKVVATEDDVSARSSFIRNAHNEE